MITFRAYDTVPDGREHIKVMVRDKYPVRPLPSGQNEIQELSRGIPGKIADIIDCNDPGFAFEYLLEYVLNKSSDGLYYTWQPNRIANAILYECKYVAI